MVNRHFVGDDFKVRMSSCVNCGHAMDSAMSIDHNNRPQPGNIAICIRCSHIMAYAEDLSLRNLTDDEMRDVAGDRTIIDALDVIAEVRKKCDHRSTFSSGCTEGVTRCDKCGELFGLDIVAKS